MSALDAIVLEAELIAASDAEFCEYVAGIKACVYGLPLTDNRSETWQSGYIEAYERLEAITGMGGSYESQ